MKKRKAQLEIERDYREAMGINRLSIKDDSVINNIIETVRTWQGFFPGEDQDSVAINRETDKRAVKGFTDGLIQHFKTLGLVDDKKSDYYNLFSLYKEYIESDPDGVMHPAATIDKEGQPLADEPDKERDKQTENDMSESPQHKPVESTFLIKTQKGEKKMTSIGEVLNASAGILGQSAPAQVASTGVSSELQSVAATRAANEQMQERITWSANHPIKYLLVVHKPLKERLAYPEKTTYPIVNAAARMSKIVDSVWAAQKKSTQNGPVDSQGNVNGELAIPDCVTAIGAENVEKYILMMTTLQKAALDPNYEIEVDLDYRFSGWKGVELENPVTEGQEDSVVKWSGLKGVIANNAMASLALSANPNVLVQQYNISSKQLQSRKKIESLEDLLSIRVVGSSEAIDLTTGAVKEGIARYAYEVLDEADNEPIRNARSKMKFSYKKMVKTADGEMKERTSSVALYLIVPVKKEKLVQANYEIFKGGSLGVRSTAYTEEERLAQVSDMMAAALANHVSDSRLASIMAETVKEQQTADSAAAAETDSELQ